MSAAYLLDSETDQHFLQCGTLWSAATCESVDCASVLTFQQPVNATIAYHLFNSSFVNSITLYTFNWYKFLSKILSLLLKTMFTNTAVM